jgi:hypothetical protein
MESLYSSPLLNQTHPKSVEALVLEPELGLTELSPGDLDQTPENVGEDANLSSLYDLVPSCSILAGMTDDEDLF